LAPALLTGHYVHVVVRVQCLAGEVIERGVVVSDYTIERGLGVRERMDLLAAVRGPATQQLLDSLALGAGARCVDIGCGGGHVTIELARRVGPSGFVLGIDLDEALLEAARHHALASDLDNITFRVSAAEDLAETNLDLAFSRLVLMHLPDPQRVVCLMADAIRPGGVVAVEDANFDGCFAYPSCTSFGRWVDWYQQTVRRNGGDPELGLRLPTLLRSAGLTLLGVRVVQDAFVEGPYKQLQQMSMLKQRAAVLAAGVAGADEYDVAHAEVRAFADDPTTMIAGPRVIQAWGKRQ
jgi:2-polyprenyl-3-methyl-5-hydroxy-6-metoxy-1,4-benzoquinol methylase